MKKIVKKSLVLLLVLSILSSFAVMPVSADSTENVLFESELTAAESGVEVSNFGLVNWAAARCRYSTSRNIYYNNNQEAYMIFDAGEKNVFTGGEFEVTVSQYANKWFFTDADKKINRVYVSDDKEAWTNVTDVATTEFTTPVTDGGVEQTDSAPWTNTTFKFTAPTSARYVKFVVPGGGVYVHGAKLYGEEKPFFESDLTAANASVEASNFELQAGMYGRCDYTEARDIYTNTAISDAYLIFDAGEGNGFTKGELKVTMHGSTTWMITDKDALFSRLKVSNDKESWASVSTAAYETGEVKTVGEGENAVKYYNYTLTFATKSARYLKYDVSTTWPEWTGYAYIHNAKLYGGEKPLFESTLTAAEDSVEVNGFELTAWSSARCGYSSTRNIYNNSSKDNAYMIFDAGENNKFTHGELLITLHGSQVYMAENSDYLVNMVKVSDNKTDWANTSNISYVKDNTAHYDGSNPHYNYTISFDTSTAARYIKFDASAAGATWRVFIHNAKLYGETAEAKFEMTTAPFTMVQTDNGVTTHMVMGAFKNPKNDTETAVLGIYSGNVLKAAGVQRFETPTGEKTIYIPVVYTPSEGETVSYKLFVWSADGITPVTEAVTVAAPAN